MAATPPPYNATPEDAKWRRWVEAQLADTRVATRAADTRAIAAVQQATTIVRQVAPIQDVANDATRPIPVLDDVVITTNVGEFDSVTGIARTRLVLEWTPVGADGNGNPITPDYQVWVSINNAEYQLHGATSAATYELFAPPGATVRVGVKVGTGLSGYGAISNYASVVAALPPFGLEVPTMPVLASVMGTVTIHWDGDSVSGAMDMPEFRYVFAEESETETGTYVRVGQPLTGAGDTTATPPVNTIRWYRLRAVDSLGRVTSPSAVNNVAVHALGVEDIDDAIIDAINDAKDTADTALTSANGKNTNYYQASAPAPPDGGFKVGDNWFDTDDNNKLYVWSGSAWVLAQDSATAQATANTKIKTYAQTSAPASGMTTGDVWIDTDDNNRMYRYNGSAWVDVRDGTIATAQTTANNALTSANGKNTIYYQTTMPTGGTYTVGDTWFDTDDGNRVYRYNGTTFVTAQFGTNALSDNAINAAKLASNAVTTAKIANDAVDFTKLATAVEDSIENAQDTADNAQTIANAAQTAADNAQAAASAAQTAADQAAVEALAAAGLAGSKGKVWSQPTQPPNGAVYSWTGAADASASIETTEGVETRRNRTYNPSAELNTAGWIGARVNVTRDTTKARYGSASFKLTTATTGINYIIHGTSLADRVPVTGGETLTMLASMWSPIAMSTVRLQLYEYDAGGTLLSPILQSGDIDVAANEWVDMSAQFTVKANAATVRQVIQVPNVFAVGEAWWVDGIALGTDTYFDGNTPDDREYDLWIDTTGGANTPKRWNGTGWTAITDKVATDAANTAVAAQTAADAVRLRGNDLVTNGNAILGNNTNFSTFVLETGDTPPGAAGAFYAGTTTPGTVRFLDELIAVDPSKKYLASIAGKQVNAGVSSRIYYALVPHDVDGLSFSPTFYMEQAGTRTTLAADLVAGQTTMQLTSAANWNNAAGASAHLRNVIFWNYVDGKGKAWAPGTYSRNVKGDAYADGGISGNTVTLRTAHVGATIPAGTPVSNGSAGGTYMYAPGINYVLLPTDQTWASFTATAPFTGLHTNSLAPATTAFPPATAFVKVGVLLNYGVSGGTSKQLIANVSLVDGSGQAAQATADAAQTIANAAQTAADAAASAASAAQTAANNAQTTANGKNKVVRSTSAASSPGSYVAGDQWWQYSGSEIVGLWIHNGSAWVSQTLTDAVITNLNAGSITAGTLNAARIGANTITGTMIAGTTITAANMVSGTITAASGIIADAAIGNAKIIDGAITTAKIADAQITNAKIANLDAAKITTGTLNAARIGANSITGTHIAGETVTASNMVSGTITAASGVLADAVIGTAKIIDGAITTAKIEDLAVTNAKIGNLDAAKITTGELDAGRIGANSITGDKIAANTISTQKLLVADFENYFLDPLFADPAGYSPWSVVSGGIQKAGTGAQHGAYFASTDFVATPEDRFRVTATRTNVAGGTGTATIYIQWYNASNSLISTVSGLSLAVAGQASGLEIVPPAGTVRGRVGFHTESTMTSGTTVRIENVIIRRLMTGALIVDGAIDGKTITGALVQSTSLANRGVKLSSTGLIAYNNSGATTFSVDGTTGALTASGTFSSGSGNNIFIASTNGIQLGHATFASAPFRVTSAGALTATSATITGTINATGGTFSGAISLNNFITAQGTTSATAGFVAYDTSGSGRTATLRPSGLIFTDLGTGGTSITFDARRATGGDHGSLNQLELRLHDNDNTVVLALSKFTVGGNSGTVPYAIDFRRRVQHSNNTPILAFPVTTASGHIGVKTGTTLVNPARVFYSAAQVLVSGVYRPDIDPVAGNIVRGDVAISHFDPSGSYLQGSGIYVYNNVTSTWKLTDLHVKPQFLTNGINAGSTMAVSAATWTQLSTIFGTPTTNRGFTSWTSGVLTIKEPGIYRIEMQLFFLTAVASNIRVTKNSTSPGTDSVVVLSRNEPTSGVQNLSMNTVELQAGDVLRAYVYCTAAATIRNLPQTFLNVSWVAPL